MMDPRPDGKRRSFPSVKRQALRISGDEIVRSRHLDPEGPFLRVIEPNDTQVDLVSWAAGHRDEVASQLLESGAILFRGFGVDSPECFAEVVSALAPDQLDYKERAAPRTEVGSKVYTSTEFPADQVIPMHHEMSYSHNWPTKLFFYCDVPAASGGRTPLTDDRRFLPHLDPEIRRPFEEKKVMYVRNYGEGVDLPWQEVFQSTDRAEVERYCRESFMEVEWRDGDRLRTRAVRQVLATHPATGEVVWFNHAHLFHHSSLDPAVRAALLSEFAEDELPRNAFYGDGSPIDEAVLEGIRELYQRRAQRFTWEKGDLLMVDNFLVSHGREAFEGPRRILVTMAELYTNTDL